MLASKIHRKWDASFCASTTLQLGVCGMSWDDIWLTGEEVRQSEERWTERPGGGLSSAITNNASSARRFAHHHTSSTRRFTHHCHSLLTAA